MAGREIPKKKVGTKNGPKTVVTSTEGQNTWKRVSSSTYGTASSPPGLL